MTPNIIVIHVTMIARNDLLCPPPIGHFGCYAARDDLVLLGCQPGRLIRFESEAGVAAEGTITFLEQPGSCVRPDMREFENWYKVHWVSTNHAQQTPGTNCPECGGESKIEHTEKGSRWRRCAKNHQWKTTEIYDGRIKAVGRPKSTRTARPKQLAFDRKEKTKKKT